MGMFSYIFCKAALPLNEDLKSLNLKWDEIEFQTKDLENCLEKYTITEEGYLVENVEEYEYTYYTKEEKKTKKLKPWDIVKEQKIIKQYTKNVNFHGKITFYEILKFSETEDIWIDFDAYFVYGKLDKIELTKTEKIKSRENGLAEFIANQKKLKNSILYKIKKYSGWYWLFRQISKCCYNLSRLFSNIHFLIIRYFLR